MKTKLIRPAMVLTLICTLTTAATADSASDAALKRKLLGYWKSGRHSYLFKSDGICYMVEGTTTYHWDIRGGMYYMDATPYKIVSLNGKEFEYCSPDKNAKPFIRDGLERCSTKDIEQLKECCSDWMKEHE
jgi:hypothetical protein